MGLFSRRTEGPEGLSMAVTETFFIALGSKGATALGQLNGEGLLMAKDLAVVDGEEWPIVDLEGFKQSFKKGARPGNNVAVAFGLGVPKDVFDGKTLTFRRR
jgi:hypothetical protein